MDSNIWSRLPLELLLSIIWHANNDSKWCEIVRGNSILYAAVVAQHARRVGHIGWKDLVMPPKLYENTSDNQIEWQNLTKVLEENEWNGLVHDLLSMNHGVCAGHYIRKLSLHFWQSARIRTVYSPPSHQMIDYTMQLLVPVLKSVDWVSIKGPPSNKIFEAISQLDSTRLKRLHVESLWENYAFRSSPTEQDLEFYDWRKLAKLIWLTELVVTQVLEEETESLHELISSLDSLQTLSLGPRSDTLEDGPACQGKISPLQALFESDSSSSRDGHLPNLLACLPSTLQKLEIQDPYYLRYLLMH